MAVGLLTALALGAAASAGSAQSVDRAAREVRPVPYCWHNSGWNGSGWYRCGFAWRYGYGWGGPRGWQGWPAPIARDTSAPRRVVRMVEPAAAPAFIAPAPSGVRDYGRFVPPAF